MWRKKRSRKSYWIWIDGKLFTSFNSKRDLEKYLENFELENSRYLQVLEVRYLFQYSKFNEPKRILPF